jgi:A/G-specific adenine glycosylase
MKRASFNTLSKLIARWYKTHHRPLPWRASRDPYRIWISEIMLQQTTVAAVAPYYERFIERFPSVKSLAASSLEEVLTLWSGLGYYSRARNLHRAAQHLAQTGFPKSAALLLELPGFGPYTSRAVASLAFGESVGVVDGNVIRVLSRVFAIESAWWKAVERNQIQEYSDQLVKNGDPYVINQALMDLGASVCTPKNPLCTLCPWLRHCQAHQMNLTAQLPLAKPKQKTEIWLWQPQVLIRKDRIAVVENANLPFLKGHLVFPGSAEKVKIPPKAFKVRHTITRYQIYVNPQKNKLAKPKGLTWIHLDDFRGRNPSSLMQKILIQQQNPIRNNKLKAHPNSTRKIQS